MQFWKIMLNLLQWTFYLAMFREDETRENWESFNEFKDRYMASLNLHSLPEGLQIYIEISSLKMNYVHIHFKVEFKR